MPLDLNLATRPFRNNTLLWSGNGLVVLALAVFGWWNVTTYVEHVGRLRELRNTVGTFQSQSQELETRRAHAQAAIKQADLVALQAQTAKANEIIDWKAFSWTRLFNQLERIQPHQVRMNTVRPIFQPRGGEGGERRSGAEDGLEGIPVAVEGTARGLEDFTEFEHRLQNDAHFRRVLPESVNRTEAGEILFRLRFSYAPQIEVAARPAEAPAAGTGQTTEVGEAWPQAEEAPSGPRPAARGAGTP